MQSYIKRLASAVTYDPRESQSILHHRVSIVRRLETKLNCLLVTRHGVKFTPFDEVLQGLTDEELEKAFDEMIECRKEGLYPNGVFHSVHRTLKSMTGNSVRWKYEQTEHAILMEIARRRYYGNVDREREPMVN